VSDAPDDLNITNPEHAEHHIVTPTNYLFVYIALIVGTILASPAPRPALSSSSSCT
jgi:cytochrome c oxidase subunit 4